MTKRRVYSREFKIEAVKLISLGRLPAAGVHDARPRRGGRQSVEPTNAARRCPPRIEGCGPASDDRPTSRRRKEQRKTTRLQTVA